MPYNNRIESDSPIGTLCAVASLCTKCANERLAAHAVVRVLTKEARVCMVATHNGGVL